MTVNLPDKLSSPLKDAVVQRRYASAGELCVSLVIWDIHCRQPHQYTGPVMRQPQWAIDARVDQLLARLGIVDERRNVGPRRFSVRVPACLKSCAQKREEEEHYRSASAYVVSLVLYALDPDQPRGKGVPHRKLAALLHEPKPVREAVFAQLAKDFGDPARVWPYSAGGPVKQLTLRI